MMKIVYHYVKNKEKDVKIYRFKKIPVTLLGSVGLLLLLGAGPSAKIDPEIPDISRRINEFTMDLLKHDADSKNAPSNTILSPQSIFHGLAMSYIASGGETGKELADVCHFPDNKKLLLQSLTDLRKQLQETAGKKRIDVSIANSLWMDETYAKFRDEYIDEIQETFDASLYQIKFAQKIQACKYINRWISDKTHGKIQKSVNPEDFNCRTRPGVIDEPGLVSVNAVYFKADWGSQFDKSSTRKLPFHLPDSKTVEAVMMHQCSLLPYSENDQIKFLEIPYIDGAYSMYVILPKNVIPIRELTDIINTGMIADLKRNAFEREVDVLLPKFEITSHLGVKNALSEMGVKSAFDKQKADFDKMIVKNTEAFRIYLSEIYHDAWIDVHEEGTEAAAATTTEYKSFFGGSAKLNPDSVKFHADHPFMFMIVHNPSRSILFAGWISDPAKLTQ